MKRLTKPLWHIETPDSGDGGDGGAEGGAAAQTFTQADVDKLVGKARTEERRKASEKYADYDELKTKAAGAKTLEDRIAEIEKTASESAARALRAEIANAHGISAEDRDLFLTGTDEASLTAQAERLAGRAAEKNRAGNHVPREGEPPKKPASSDEMTEFTRQLFGNGD